MPTLGHGLPSYNPFHSLANHQPPNHPPNHPLNHQTPPLPISFHELQMGATLPMLCCFWDFLVVEQLSLKHLPALLIGGGEEEEEEEEEEGDGEDNGDDEGEGEGEGEGEDGEDDAEDEGDAVVKTEKGSAAPLVGSLGWIDTELVAVRPRLYRWAVRTGILACAFLGMAYWRIMLNGDTSPYFRYNSNRHAIEPIDGTIPMELIVGEDTGYVRFRGRDRARDTM